MAAFCAALGLGDDAPVEAQPGLVDPGPVPAGLDVAWKADGRKLPRAVTASSVLAFSADSRLLAIGDETGVRVRRTDDGTLIEMYVLGSDPTIYSLAVSKSGEIAVGRVGAVEIHRPEGSPMKIPYVCSEDCSPVGAVAFSPDGELLAFQGRRSTSNRRRGLGSVSVVDVRSGMKRAELPASAARARVAFTTDGKRLLAANTTPFDDVESFGLRAWTVSDWVLERRLLGESRASRSEGTLKGAGYAAVYERNGRLELVDLATGAMLWSTGLIAPGFELEADEYTTRLDRIELAPNGDFIISYETPIVPTRRGTPVGTIVIRSSLDGAIVSMFDVPNVAAIAMAPDGNSFAYATGSGQTSTVLARVRR